jgi:Guanylate-binding protein, C-terminal domain
MQHLTKLIFARAQPKRLGNNMLTGSMLAALTEAYVDAINHGAVPTIATAWQVGSTLGLPCCFPG